VQNVFVPQVAVDCPLLPSLSLHNVSLNCPPPHTISLTHGPGLVKVSSAESSPMEAHVILHSHRMILTAKPKTITLAVAPSTAPLQKTEGFSQPICILHMSCLVMPPLLFFFFQSFSLMQIFKYFYIFFCFICSTLADPPCLLHLQR
jgi:hypothetical protein